MALPLEDDKNKPQSPVGAAAPAKPEPATPAVAAKPLGAPAVAAGSQAPAPGAAKPAAPKGTGFTNIQRVMGASRGNKLGSTVVGGIQQAGQQAQQGIQKAQSQFQEGVNANLLGTEQNQAAATGLIGSAAAGGDLSEEQLAQAGKFREGQYAGPSGLKDASQLAGRAQDAERLGQLSTSAGGRQGLLQQFVGKPQYGAGQQRLDSLLLGQDRAAVNQARAATAGLSDQANRSLEAAGAQGQEAAGRNKEFAQKFLGEAGGKQTGIAGELDTEAKSFLGEEAAKYTPEALAKSMGEQNVNMFGMDLTPTQKAELAKQNPELMGVTGGDMSQQQIQDMLAKGDFSSLRGRTSEAAQGKTKGFNALNKLIGKGDNIDASKLANRGKAGINDAAMANLQGGIDSEAKNAAEAGYTPEAMNEYEKQATDEEFRRAGGGADQAAEASMKASEAFQNKGRANAGTDIFNNPATIAAMKATSDQNRAGEVAKRAAAMRAEGGASGTGDSSRAAGKAARLAREDRTSGAGKEYYQSQLTNAQKAEVLKRFGK